METNKVYRFKEEFCKELNIPMNQAERKLDELLEWLNNFFVYDFLPGRPNRIFIKEIIGEYQPLPRKKHNQDALNTKKITEYTNFAIASLGTQYKPNSKMKASRDAINAFGKKIFHHTNAKYVAKTYVGPAFNTYGESDGKKIWVYYNDYTPIPAEELEQWRLIRHKCNIDQDEAANAFYKYAQGENIDVKVNAYKKAMDIFMEKYGDFPVLVESWRLKKQG